MIKQLLKIVAVAFAVCLAVGIGFYVYFVHPDDKRLAPLSLAGLAPPKLRYEQAASLLKDMLPHTLDLAEEVYRERRRELFRSLPEAAQPEGLRFKSPYQVYVPVGRYPTRLEALDALFVPAGGTLRVRPQLAGRFQIRFLAIAAQGRATLTLRLGERKLYDEPLQGDVPYEPRRGLALQYDNIMNVERRAALPRWQEGRVDVELTPKDEVAFRCAEGSLGCLVGDVTFLKEAGKPARNTLVILIDTMRGDAVRGGHAAALAAFAREATSFSNAIAPGNMTSPSTNGLLSCRRPSDIGAVAFAYAVNEKQRAAFYQAQKPSFPALFSAAGYHTAMIGNISVISEIYGVGVHHGFDEQVSIEAEAYDTPQIAAEAVRWLRQNADRPFLLYLHFNGPHAPYRAPWQDLKATYPGPQAFSSYPSILRWLYQSEIHYTDRYLAQVFDAVRKLGLWDETTIALSADHGDQHESREFQRNTVGPNFEGAYFDHGATMLDDEVNVPFMIKHPAQKTAQRYDAHVPTLSLGPTLLELSGLEVPAHCQAPSLASALTTGSTPRSPAVFGSEGFRGRAIYFEGRYKYVRSYEPTDKRVYGSHTYRGAKRLYLVPEELYDLASDPSELRDLGRAEPVLLERARSLYREFYRIKDAYELVVEVPSEDAYVVSFAPGADVQAGDEQVGASVQGRGPARLIFLVRKFGAKLPDVRVAGTQLPLKSTSLRLPVAPQLEDLPEEPGGPYTLLPERKSATAYLRRVPDDGQLNRRIVTGNAQFEKVLREWGYLNDQ